MSARPRINVERLREATAGPLDALVADSEAGGVRFVRRLTDEWITGVNRFEKPGETLLVARCAGIIVGVCGLNIDPYAAGSPARVGRVRHLYVLSTHRRLGIGETLVTHVLAAARGHFDRLHLRTTNPGAAALYERLGFHRRPNDEHCTHVIDVDGIRGDTIELREQGSGMTPAAAIEAPAPRSRRWASLLGVPLAVAAIVAASTPSIAHALPRLFFPAVATVGAGATTVAFVRALRSRNLRRVAVTLIAFVVLVVLPATHLVGVLTAPVVGPPKILVGFGGWLGGEGYPRPSAHRGVDFKGVVGSDVLATADGRVVVARDHGDLCGLIVAIFHEPYGYRTVYCHFATLLVRAGDEVRRGQRIGTVGTTGQRAWPGYEHVHLELQRGTNLHDLEDPMRRMAGCFDEHASYPTDRLVLTYPLACRSAR